MNAVLNSLALPIALVLFALASWVLSQAAVYLRERTHNERLARLVGAMSRVAGDISDKLAALPPGTDPRQVKADLIAAGIKDVRIEFSGTLAKLNAPGVDRLAPMLRGEFGKLQAPSLLPANIVVSDPKAYAPDLTIPTPPQNGGKPNIRPVA